jgi:peptidoglycan/LPS O-acetylase OafA/YrhL
MAGSPPAATADRDPEAEFTVADPGKEWRRGRGIPVVRAFDGYRALAVVAVVLFHVFEVCGVTHHAGDSAAGVLIWGLLPGGLYAFFIVSGFVMFLPTVARDGDFGRVGAFAIRRAARLLPAYWLALAAALVLIAALGSAQGFPSAGTVVSHFAVLQGEALLFVNHYSLGFSVIPPVWTLSVEVVFYILLPLVAVFYFRHPLVGLGIATAMLIGAHELGTHATAVAGWFGTDLSPAAQFRVRLYYASQFPSWAFAIASGMTAAWAYIRLRDHRNRESIERWATYAVGPAGMVLVVVLAILAGREAVGGAAFNGLFASQSLWISLGYPAALAVLFLAVAFAPARLQRPVTNAPIRWLADISYGIYLIHFAVIWVLLRHLSLSQDGSAGITTAWIAIVFGVSISYAYLSARLLERPVRRWAHRFGRRHQAGAEVRTTS